MLKTIIHLKRGKYEIHSSLLLLPPPLIVLPPCHQSGGCLKVYTDRVPPGPAAECKSGNWHSSQIEVIGFTNFRFQRLLKWTGRRWFQDCWHSVFLALGSLLPSFSYFTCPASCQSGLELVSGQVKYFLYWPNLSFSYWWFQSRAAFPALSWVVFQLINFFFLRRTLITHLRGLLYLAIAVCASAQVKIPVW